MEYIIQYMNELWQLLNEMAIYLLIGFLFAGILHVFIPKERVSRYLGKKNALSVMNATLLGIPLPLCSCGVIPAGISFYRNGASKGATTSFLISTPQTGVDSMLVTYSLLGLPMALIRPVIAFITGIAGGIITNKIDNEQPNRLVQAEKKKSEKKSIGKRVVEVFQYGFIEFMQDIAKWLVIGLLIAALLAVLIPDSFFTTYIQHGWINMLIVLAASVPLYVCATGSVPIAAVLMMKGLSPGAALVFLMAGPATNAATLAVLGKTIGKKATIAYLLTITLGALLGGWVIDQFLPAEWFSLAGVNAVSEHFIPGNWQAVASVLLILLLVLNMAIKWNKSRKEKSRELEGDASQQIKTFVVEGMTCVNCKAHVEEGIRGLDGITDVKADLDTGEVRILGDTFDVENIQLSVEKGGYVFKGEKN